MVAILKSKLAKNLAKEEWCGIDLASNQQVGKDGEQRCRCDNTCAALVEPTAAKSNA